MEHYYFLISPILKEENICILWQLGKKEWDIGAFIVVLCICMLSKSLMCLFFHSSLEEIEWEILALAYYLK